MRTELQTEQAHRAYQRIDALLRAYGIRNAAVRADLSQRILSEALAESNQDEALEAVGARISLDKMKAAIRNLLPTVSEESAPSNETKLYLALQRTRLPQTQPDLLLGGSQLSPEAQVRLKQSFALQKTPALRRQSMGAPTLRFESIEDVASGTTALFERWPQLRRVTKLLGVALVALLVYQFAK